MVLLSLLSSCASSTNYVPNARIVRPLPNNVTSEAAKPLPSLPIANLAPQAAGTVLKDNRQALVDKTRALRRAVKKYNQLRAKLNEGAKK